ALLVGGGALALIGSKVWGESTSSARFLLSGGGFAVGVFAAIWLARRVEEGEDRLKRRRNRL
ncbi:MAG: hypothetical protein HYZ27_12595, partial [Deltaproteobacteria bacterium]|nr:hypothetical protein [Deltaproteobacteria bacterium]